VTSGANNFNNSHENQLAKFLTLQDFWGEEFKISMREFPFWLYV